MKYSIENIDNIVIFVLKNEVVDSKISAELKAKLLITCQPDIEALIMDITHVQSFDSAGIGSVLLAERQLAEYEVPMLIVGANSFIHEMFQLLRLDDLFDFYPTVEEALKDLENS